MAGPSASSWLVLVRLGGAGPRQVDNEQVMIGPSACSRRVFAICAGTPGADLSIRGLCSKPHLPCEPQSVQALPVFPPCLLLFCREGGNKLKGERGQTPDLPPCLTSLLAVVCLFCPSAEKVFAKLQESVDKNPRRLGRSSKHVINTRCGLKQAWSPARCCMLCKLTACKCACAVLLLPATVYSRPQQARRANASLPAAILA